MFTIRRALKKFFEKHFAKPKGSFGFTLAELSVTIFIILLITAVVIYNHQAFADNLEITNLAYDIALSIRETQVSGIAVRPSEGSFENAFGVYFFIGNGGNDKAFISFVDIDDNSWGEPYEPDKMYNGSFSCGSDEVNGDQECLKRIDITKGNKISHICYRQPNGQLRCGSPTTQPRGVNITFLRPKPDAFTIFLNPGGNKVQNADDREAVICLESPLGKKKTVHVLSTGQISVRNESCSTAGFHGGS